MRKQPSAVLALARESIASPVDFDALLAKAGARDRTNIERHVSTSIEQGARSHADVYRRLVRILGTLAPLPVQTLGQQTVMFFVADGKYRMQVFALEDSGDGKILVYVPDILAEGVKAGAVSGKTVGEEQAYTTATGEPLPVETLNASNTPNPPAHVKNMLGWNRKAVRVTLSAGASAGQVQAVEDLCALSARQWIANAVAAAEKATAAAGKAEKDAAAKKPSAKEPVSAGKTAVKEPVSAKSTAAPTREAVRTTAKTAAPAKGRSRS